LLHHHLADCMQSSRHRPEEVIRMGFRAEWSALIMGAAVGD